MSLRSLKSPRLGAAAFLTLLSVGWSRPGAAQTQAGNAAPPADSSTAPAAAPQPLPRYHHSVFSWEHHTSAQTLGIGDDPQSSNPTYTMGLSAKTRYYLMEQPGRLLSVRLEGGLYREFTNSDSTTQRGEWSFVDTGLSLAYAHRLRGGEADATLLELRPIMLTLPTSKSSYESGRYFAAGALVGINHLQPILTQLEKPQISSALRLAVGYERWFARATVPTSPSFSRVRLSTEGRSVAGDQLSGSSLVRDQLVVSGRVRLGFGESVVWTTDFGIAPSWKYDLGDDVELCGVVDTGCADIEVSQDDTRYLVSTQFNTEVSVRLMRSLSLEVGYGNASNQLGPDGRRRSMFYSPYAEFYASLSFTPHELVSTPKQSAQAALHPTKL